MPIPVTCGSCSKQYQAKDTLAGKKIKCQQCGGVIEIPAAAEPEPPPQAEPPEKIAVECGSCGKRFQAGLNLAGKRVKCPQCSEPITVPNAEAPPEAKPAAKKPATRRPASPSPAAAPVEAAPSPAPMMASGNSIGSILDEEFAAGAMPNVAVAGQKYCVNCKAIIPANSFFCVYCGFDERSGKSINMQGTQVILKKPGTLPPLGYVVGVLAILFGLVLTGLTAWQTYESLMIFIDKGLPDGTDPDAPRGLFGFPLFLLLMIASLLMLFSAIGILMHKKGGISNAALASNVFMGFSTFAVAIMTAAIMLGANAPPKKDDPDAKHGTFEFLTIDVYTQICLALVVINLTPAIVWLWWRFQGRRIDWELPEAEHKRNKSATGAPPSVIQRGLTRKEPNPAVKRRLAVPGTILQVLGWLAVVGSVLGTIQMIVWLVTGNPPAGLEGVENASPIAGLIGCGVQFALGFMHATAGTKMKETEGYGLCLACSILSLCGCLPLGVWLLVLLLQSDVKNAFQS